MLDLLLAHPRAKGSAEAACRPQTIRGAAGKGRVAVVARLLALADELGLTRRFAVPQGEDDNMTPILRLLHTEGVAPPLFLLRSAVRLIEANPPPAAQSELVPTLTALAAARVQLGRSYVGATAGGGLGQGFDARGSLSVRQGRLWHRIASCGHTAQFTLHARLDQWILWPAPCFGTVVAATGNSFLSQC